MNHQKKLVISILLGQTASGKKGIAFQLAKLINAEIISVDSMKVYRRMDIGTAKPSIAERRRVKCHLIDIVEPFEDYNAARFVSDCDRAISGIVERGKMPLLLVGTPMYLKALLYGIFSDLHTNKELRLELEKTAQANGSAFLHEQLKLVDPARADKIHPNDLKRIIRALEVYSVSGKTISSLQVHFSRNELRYDVKIVGLKWSNEELYKRIDARIDKMIKAGLIDEVKSLVCATKGLSPQAEQAVGYKEVIQYLNNKLTLEQTIDLLKKNTHHLARKQMTWFRRLPDVHWVECSDKKSSASILEVVTEVLLL